MKIKLCFVRQTRLVGRVSRRSGLAMQRRTAATTMSRMLEAKPRILDIVYDRKAAAAKVWISAPDVFSEDKALRFIQNKGAACAAVLKYVNAVAEVDGDFIHGKVAEFELKKIKIDRKIAYSWQAHPNLCTRFNHPAGSGCTVIGCDRVHQCAFCGSLEHGIGFKSPDGTSHCRPWRQLLIAMDALGPKQHQWALVNKAVRAMRRLKAPKLKAVGPQRDEAVGWERK